MMGFLDDYEPVEDRLRQFWTDHPYGRVITELLHHEDGDYIVLASVYVGNELRNDPPTATGLAHDSTSSLPNNMKSSALEVCETSAIGRALANAGYAPKGKRPSREEMQKTSAGERVLPSHSAEPRPEPVERGAVHAYGEGASSEAMSTGSGELSDATEAVVEPGSDAEGVGRNSSRGAPAAPSAPSHVHEWEQAPREGWAVCECGTAEKLSKVTIHTAPIELAEVRADML
jgi:hypothetical protein